MEILRTDGFVVVFKISFCESCRDPPNVRQLRVYIFFNFYHSINSLRMKVAKFHEDAMVTSITFGSLSSWS